MINQRLMLSLIDISKSRGAHDRQYAYWNTYYCLERLVTSNEGKFYGKYCKNRFCSICACIRKADIMNRYLPIIRSWEQPCFVTITAKAVPARSLNKRMDDMQRGIKKLINRYKKREERGKGKKFMGIRSLECNFNPLKRTYNPHFHLILPDKETADRFIDDWVKLCTEKGKFPHFAKIYAQKASVITDVEKALIEVVKYCSKIFTDPTMQKKSKGSSQKKIPPRIYLAAFDNIVAAMKRHRVFDRFGFNLPKQSKRGGKQSTLTDYDEVVYDNQVLTWISEETEQIILQFKPNPELVSILDNNINLTDQ